LGAVQDLPELGRNISEEELRSVAEAIRQSSERGRDTDVYIQHALESEPQHAGA
jgi:hypothetical protein